MTSATGSGERSVHSGKVAGWRSKVFALNPAGLNWSRAVMVLDVVLLLVQGVGIRFWNYALYCAAIAAGVLTFENLTKPSDYAAEGYRVLWTLCGVGIGVLVMFLAGLLARRTAKAPPQPATQPA